MTFLTRLEACTKVHVILHITCRLINKCLFYTGVTFMDQTYSVREDQGILTVTIERYGDTEGQIVALIATHPTEGTADGML